MKTDKEFRGIANVVVPCDGTWIGSSADAFVKGYKFGRREEILKNLDLNYYGTVLDTQADHDILKSEFQDLVKTLHLLTTGTKWE